MYEITSYDTVTLYKQRIVISQNMRRITCRLSRLDKNQNEKKRSYKLFHSSEMFSYSERKYIKNNSNIMKIIGFNFISMQILSTT